MFASTLFRSSPFEDLWRLHRELDELLGDGTAPGAIRSVPHGAFPALNIGQTPEKVDVYLFAPGIDPKSLQISIQQNLLTISGERRVAVNESATYYRRERFDGAFQRAITLPEDVNPERIEARYRDGIVHISIQRHEAARPRQIEIQSA
jgi:HSP20 family protein